MTSQNNDAEQIIGGGIQNKNVTSTSFAAKYRSKREVYNFLTVEVGAYLPDYHTITIYFLRDLISGKKKFIKNNQVQHITIPHYEGLTVKIMLDFLGKYQEAQEYAPDICECFRLPRVWVGNLGYTIVGAAFQVFIKNLIEVRNSKVAIKKDLFINMDPQVAAAFQASTAVSTSKGIGANMLKVGTKRRRTKTQVEMEKEEAELKEQSIQQQLNQVEQIKQQKALLEQQIQSLSQDPSPLLHELVNNGIAQTDGDGNVFIPSGSKQKNHS